MAANGAVAKNGALSFMTKLSPTTYLYRPDVSGSSAAAPSEAHRSAPELVLICSWMDARDIHVTKYILPYQALYPSAQILLIKCDMGHFLNRSAAYREALLAAPVVRAAVDASNPEPQLAIHVLSNGGSTMLRHLYRAYRETAAPGEATVLPLHTTIFDSAPGEFSYGRSVVAMTASMPAWMKWLVGPFLRLWIMTYFLWYLVPYPDPLQRLARSHNKTENANEVRRTYIYSKEDQLVDWKVVEKYAADAAARGFVVRKERFDGSAHVAHARFDGDRYWKAVAETWDGASTA